MIGLHHLGFDDSDPAAPLQNQGVHFELISCDLKVRFPDIYFEIVRENDGLQGQDVCRALRKP